MSNPYLPPGIAPPSETGPWWRRRGTLVAIAVTSASSAWMAAAALGALLGLFASTDGVDGPGEALLAIAGFFVLILLAYGAGATAALSGLLLVVLVALKRGPWSGREVGHVVHAAVALAVMVVMAVLFTR